MPLNAFLRVGEDRSNVDFDLAREANHRIANNLALVAASVRAEARKVAERKTSFSNEDVGLMLAEIAARIDGVGRLHKMLSDVPEGAVDIGEHLTKMCDSLKPFISAGGPIELFCDFAPGCVVPSDQIMPIARIVIEMVMNAVKYAHPAGVRGRVDVGCGQADGKIVIDVCDDGVGLPDGFDVELGGNVGLSVVRTLCAQLGATPLFDSSALGLRFLLVLPTPR